MSDPKPPAKLSEPVSARIRARIVKAKRRFNANDNIAAFIEPGELEALQLEVEGKMKAVLESLVINTETDVHPGGLPRPLRGGAARYRIPQRFDAQ
jgi:hypothetical protein